MPKYVIERDLPGLGGSSELELQAVSEKSCGVLRELSPGVQWKHSYVTADKMYCVYSAASEDLCASTPAAAASPPTASRRWSP